MELKLKKLILEQACYYCQHNVIQHFMPEDITTFGLHPILPAMAALHDIVTSRYNDHETGSAVELLQFIHSLIPEPSVSLRRDYIKVLISLKSKAVYFEVFSSDNSFADDQHRLDILNKYFPEEDCLDEGEPIPEDCSTCEEYQLAMHTFFRHAIKGRFVSEKSRRDFQRNLLLHPSENREMWEELVDDVEHYISQIRKILPVPQLVLDCLREEDLLGVVSQSGGSDNANDSDIASSSDHPSTSPNPDHPSPVPIPDHPSPVPIPDHPSSVPIPGVSLHDYVSLRNPRVLVKKLPVGSLCTDHRSSSDTATKRRPSYHRNSSDPGSNKRQAYISHGSDSDTACSSSDSKTTQSEVGAEIDSDSRKWGKLRQNPHTSTKPSITLEGFATPNQMPTAASKLDPKEARVMGSIARKKRFLTGSPMTSSDDSSLRSTLVTFRKPRQVKPVKLARHLSKSFVSPEIPLITSRPGSLVNPGVHLNNDNANVVGVVSPASSPVTIGEHQIYGRGNEPHVVTDHLCKIKPDLLQPFNRWPGTDATYANRQASITSSEPLSSKQTHTVTSGDEITQPVAGRVLRTNRRRVLKKGTMADEERDRDFVSGSESESPLRNRSSPLQGLSMTLRRAL